MKHKWELLNEGYLKFFGLTVRALSYPATTEAYVLVEKGTPAALVVFVFIAPGTASVTLYPGKDLRSRVLEVLTAIHEDIDEYAAVKGLKRIQANTKSESRYINFIKRCGFEFECVLKKFCNGEDYVSWVYFPGD